jgi:hypothetical protein
MMEEKDYTRVTSVLAPFAGYGNIPKEILDKAADRGTRAHAAINTYLSGFGSWGVDSDIEGYIKSAEVFFPRLGRVIHHEERFFNHDLELTGQCDMIAEVDGIITLIDWKTSSKPNPTWEAQAGGYVTVAPKGIFKRAMFVKLSKDGKDAEIFEYKDLEYCRSHFCDCFVLYKKYFKNNKLEIFE